MFLIATVIHYNSYDFKSKKEKIKNVVKLTYNSSLSLSLSYDKSKNFNELKNSTYPELEPTSSINFIFKTSRH